MADYGACAAAGDAGHRVPQQRFARDLVVIRDGIPRRLERKRLCRRSQRGDRISLGRKSLRPPAGYGGRSRPPAGGRYRCERRPRFCTGGKAATSTIPIVFTASSDPIKLGLVASLNRPGGNVTGWGGFVTELEPKRLELLRALVPTARAIGVFVNPSRTDAEAQSRYVEDAARALGLQVVILGISSERDIETAFASLAGRGIQGLLIGADPIFVIWRDQFITLAARHAIPAVYTLREYVAAGGLASYGTSIAEGYHQAGIYAGRILKGAKPADLPVVQPTKFEFAINFKTAKALGLTVPPTLLTAADEVIE
jgi:ABC-type uncharacterized transport system substrate-binding protein